MAGDIIYRQSQLSQEQYDLPASKEFGFWNKKSSTHLYLAVQTLL